MLEQTDVLIVGSGPVGLALAIEMGRRGIRCIVVEQNDRVGYSPRAKTTNVRTREHLRRWGIAEQLRKASTLPADYPSNIVFATRMNGPQLARIENALCCAPAKNGLYSESAQWVPQYVLEEVLRTHAASFASVEIRFDTSFLRATQDEACVETCLRGKREGDYTIASRYLIGADGARSAVRTQIGAVMSGQHGIAKNYNVQFRAPELAKLHQHGPAIMYWMVNKETPSLLGPMDGEDRWFFIATRIEDNLENIDTKAMIQKATGLQFEMEILGADPWYAHNLIADRYSEGRIFLAGDACHLHPPFGGYGMNMGIADGVDLGWKMAAVLGGWGAPGLLASYEAERRPVHQWTMDEALANYGALGNQLAVQGMEDPGPLGDATRREVGEVIYTAKLREFKSLGAVLGYRYDNSPIIVGDGSSIPAQQSMIYQPSARPGCLAPHLWLADGSSLYDHFGQGFTLLATGSDPKADFAKAAASAKIMGIPLTLIAPQDDRLCSRYRAGYALIRPDQHVAWRGDSVPENFTYILRHVTGHQQPAQEEVHTILGSKLLTD